MVELEDLLNRQIDLIEYEQAPFREQIRQRGLRLK